MTGIEGPADLMPQIGLQVDLGGPRLETIARKCGHTLLRKAVRLMRSNTATRSLIGFLRFKSIPKTPDAAPPIPSLFPHAK